MQDLIWSNQPRASAKKLIGSFEDCLDSQSFSRFAEAIAGSTEILVRWTIEPINSASNAFFWRFFWKAPVELYCHRCNNVFAADLQADAAIGLVDDKNDEPLVQKYCGEVMFFDEIESLGHVFEDDLILALPVLATCNHSSCKPKVITFGQEPEVINPFSVLKN